jgi:flagellar protein FliO/FliZ
MTGKSRALTSAFAAVAFSLSIASVSFAADDNTIIVPGASRAESGAKSGGASLNTMSLVVGLVLAGVGGWMVWRNRRGVPVARDLRSLAIDETRSLGNRQYLVVASYEGKKFLIGVCPGRIDMLSPLDGSPANERSRG